MPNNQPPQTQNHQPGKRGEMEPKPSTSNYSGCGRLKGSKAIITGGDSGIGRAVAIAFAKEGANVSIVYLEEDDDTDDTIKTISEVSDVHAISIRGDVGDFEFCRSAVRTTVEEFDGVDILVNNAAEQHPQDNLLDISCEQIESTFRTNVFSYIYMCQCALPHMSSGSNIINTSSVTAFRGSPGLIDYSATKGAIISLTRSLAINLVEKGIRVNAVSPGPIWTPLIPATFDEDHVAAFGEQVPMKRAGQPDEVSPCYVFLASSDSSYMTGQTLHPNGGEIINT